MAARTSTPIRLRVFIDSSVFLAAAYSPTGFAHDLFLAAIRGRVVLVLSDYVLAETERNLLANPPRAHAAFLQLIDSVPHVMSQPDKAVVLETARVVVAKDAPIFAAARAAQVESVATYDRKDLQS